MGTWSVDAFGSDEACDWAQSLAGSEDLSAVEAAIAAYDGTHEAAAAVRVLAAIETLARLRGHFGCRNAYTRRVDDWVLLTRLTPPDALVRRALNALDRILGNDSELRELWRETPDAQAWSDSVRALRSRLLTPPLALESAATEPSGDQVAGLIRRAEALQFAVPNLAPSAPIGALYNAVAAADALCDVASVRKTIARAWQPLEHLEKASIAWDLAVREAKTWALEGALDEALAGLEAWRCASTAAGPGQFDIRAAGVCVSGRDLDRARTSRGAVGLGAVGARDPGDTRRGSEHLETEAGGRFHPGHPRLP